MSNRVRRTVGVAGALAAAGAILIGCTWRPNRPRPTWTVPTSSVVVPSTPTTDSHGHTDEDHATMTTTTAGHGDHGH